MALQILLDMVHQYAQKWRYQLNGMKSVVMVFGEAARTREHERADLTFVEVGRVCTEGSK